MLMLLFHIGEGRYAMDCGHVIEVVPRVNLKPIAQAPEYVAGMLNYRGIPVPVVDLCHLQEGNPCGSSLHTRIIVCDYTSKNGQSHKFGLIAERVTETIHRDSSDFVDSGMRVDEIPYLGGVMTEENVVTQQLIVDILAAVIEEVLFSEK